MRLWRRVLLVALAGALVLPVGAAAAVLPKSLRDAATASPDSSFRVIVQSAGDVSAARIAALAVETAAADDRDAAVRAREEVAAAERELRSGYETLEEMRERGVLSTLAAYLADAVYAQGRWEEADRFARVSEGFATLDDVASQVWWRATRARALARGGQHEEAEAVAREALALAAPTDDLYMRGHVLLDAAEALRLGGRDGEAASLVQEAIELFTAKGDVVSAARARELV